jgi:hypothetical protein
MAMHSPLSTIITDRNYTRSVNQSLENVFKSDFELMKNLLKEREFFEGVDNLLIKKGKEDPNWMFKDLDSVPQEFVERLLAPSLSPIKLNI